MTDLAAILTAAGAVLGVLVTGVLGLLTYRSGRRLSRVETEVKNRLAAVEETKAGSESAALLVEAALKLVAAEKLQTETERLAKEAALASHRDCVERLDAIDMQLARLQAIVDADGAGSA